MRTHTPAREPRRLTATVAIMLLLTGCGSDPSGPANYGNDGGEPPHVASISISPANASLRPGESTMMTAEVRDQHGAIMTGQSPAWTSGSTSIATVSGNGSSVTVTAAAAGNAAILATIGSVTGSAAVSVTTPFATAPVALVRCSPATVTLLLGQTVTLQATAFDADGNMLSGRSANWSSSNGSVVSVNGSGDVTAVAPGAATVLVTIEGRTASCAIAVPAPVSQATIVVTNQLIATVAISIQGQVVGTVPPQSTRQTTVTSAPALDVSFEVIEPRLGTRVLGDRMSGRWSLTAPAGTINLTVDNLVGGQWYFAPLVSNLSGTPLLMAINYGLQSENRCACVVPVGGQRVFLGYYRLYSNSLLHAFSDGSNYTGPYRYFFNFGNSIPRGSGVSEFTFSAFP